MGRCWSSLSQRFSLGMVAFYLLAMEAGDGMRMENTSRPKAPKWIYLTWFLGQPPGCHLWAASGHPVCCPSRAGWWISASWADLCHGKERNHGNDGSGEGRTKAGFRGSKDMVSSHGLLTLGYPCPTSASTLGCCISPWWIMEIIPKCGLEEGGKWGVGKSLTTNMCNNPF